MRISDWSSDVCSSDLLLASYLVDRLCDHGYRDVVLLRERHLCVCRREEGCGQSVGRGCDDARMDAVEPAAVPPVQRTAAYCLTWPRPLPLLSAGGVAPPRRTLGAGGSLGAEPNPRCKDASGGLARSVRANHSARDVPR